ncbi:hypothetical protein KFK09_008258 [Dendrobium nobile]|uniref:Uncharacterized protein n=1 Tax=Dendrobium nobile TaxID=94219 RepID=A0A8T3BQE8_DENNO|nr:hypothetical protein KFK09_008258 [Dendrobium nobile]
MTCSYNHIIGVLAFSFLAFMISARADVTDIRDPNNDHTAMAAAMTAVRSQPDLSFCWLTGAQKFSKDSNSSYYHLQIVVRENDRGNKIIVDTTVIIYNDPDAVPNMSYLSRFPYFGETDSPYSRCN